MDLNRIIMKILIKYLFSQKHWINDAINDVILRHETSEHLKLLELLWTSSCINLVTIALMVSKLHGGGGGLPKPPHLPVHWGKKKALGLTYIAYWLAIKRDPFNNKILVLFHHLPLSLRRFGGIRFETLMI